MYHRVLPADDARTAGEEPGMVVTPGTFRNHLRWLRPHFELMHLRDWVEKAATGAKLPRRACAITFDDGWRDNFEFAFPILQDEKAPATIFVVSHMIGTKESFWPNRVSRILLHPRFARSDAAELQWLKSFVPPSCTRFDRELAARVIAALKALPDDEIVARLPMIETHLNIGEQAERSLLDWGELDAMVKTGLIEVGSHTCRHVRLTDGLSTAETTREVAESRQLIESRLGRPTSLFCYPNGDASRHALTLVSQHYLAAVTTSHGVNRVSTASHHLLRIGLHEDVSKERQFFLAKLSTWV